MSRIGKTSRHDFRLPALGAGAVFPGVTLSGAAAAQTVSGEPSGNAFQQLSASLATGGIEPMTAIALGAGAVAVSALAWAMKLSSERRTASADWSERLAQTEAALEKSTSVLSAHPGLVLVWNDDYAAIEDGWGTPKVLGGPAALASLMSIAHGAQSPEPEKSEMSADTAAAKVDVTDGAPAQRDGRATRAVTDAKPTPADRLLDGLGSLPIDEDGALGASMQLKDKIHALRSHGIAFSGAVYTRDGRAIEVDGRVAGDQVALWLTDPAARMAEDDGILGRVRQKAADLHGALGQLERAPLPAWRRDSDLKLVWVNAAYVSAVEATNAADVLRNQIELDSAAKRVAEKAGEDRRPSEARVSVNVGGTRRVYRVIETPMHGAGDSGLSGFAIDVSEGEKSRTDLNRHLEANRRTLDEIPAPVSIFDAAQNLTYFNTAFQRLWGIEEAELAARPSHGELLDRLREAGRLPEVKDYLAWKKKQLALYTDNLNAPGVERDGALPDDIWHLPDSRIMRVAAARHPLGGVIMIYDDITEKLRLEALYKTQMKVQRATLDNLAEAVATFSSDGTLRLYNHAFQSLWRFDESELDARPHIDTLVAQFADRSLEEHGDLFTKLRTRITSFAPEDRQSMRDASLALKDGRSLSFGAEPLPDGATLVHFLDVTDSREREKELKEKNAFLEDIDRQKSKFVDHVSYQLRTPLNTIIGFGEMIDGQMFGVLNERQKEYMASILTASYALKDLISDIMDLAAIDAGKMTLEREDVDLRELLTNAATHAALKAEDTQVELGVICDKDIGSLNADSRRLKQVLFNLLSNAFAYTGAGGKVELGVDRTPGLVRLWVQDSGRGVSPKDQPGAFDAFESSGPSAGAGLGLALVQRFVTLHGGWVRMESAPGEGTRVTCFLPTADATTAATDGSDEPGAPPLPGGPDTAQNTDATTPVTDEQASRTEPAPARKKRTRNAKATRVSVPKAKAAE